MYNCHPTNESEPRWKHSHHCLRRWNCLEVIINKKHFVFCFLFLTYKYNPAPATQHNPHNQPDFHTWGFSRTSLDVVAITSSVHHTNNLRFKEPEIWFDCQLNCFLHLWPASILQVGPAGIVIKIIKQARQYCVSLELREFIQKVNLQFGNQASLTKSPRKNQVAAYLLVTPLVVSFWTQY